LTDTSPWAETVGVGRRGIEQSQKISKDVCDVLSDINLNRFLEESMDYLLAQAGRLLGSQAIAIYCLQEDNEEIVTQAEQNVSGKDIAGTAKPFVQSALKQALRTHRPVTVLCTSSQLSLYEETKALRHLWVLPSSAVYQALLAVPIVVKKQIYGGVVLYYTEPRGFSQDEIELAVLYSNLVALAMENVSLREHLHQAEVIAEWNCFARDLYDMVTQMLFSARLIADALPRVLEHHPDEGRRGLEELSLLSLGALAQMRTLRRRLPEALTGDNLDAKLEMKGQRAVGTEISITWHTTGAKGSDEGYTAHSRHDCG
jgi:GAF domain-containing protein